MKICGACGMAIIAVPVEIPAIVNGVQVGARYYHNSCWTQKVGYEMNFVTFDNVETWAPISSVQKGDFIKTNGSWRQVFDVEKINDTTYDFELDGPVFAQRAYLIDMGDPILVVKNMDKCNASGCMEMAVVTEIMGYYGPACYCEKHAEINGRPTIGSWELIQCAKCEEWMEKETTSSDETEIFEGKHYHRICYNEMTDPNAWGYDESTNPSNGWRDPNPEEIYAYRIGN